MVQFVCAGLAPSCDRDSDPGLEWPRRVAVRDWAGSDRITSPAVWSQGVLTIPHVSGPGPPGVSTGCAAAVRGPRRGVVSPGPSRRAANQRLRARGSWVPNRTPGPGAIERLSAPRGGGPQAPGARMTRMMTRILRACAREPPAIRRSTCAMVVNGRPQLVLGTAVPEPVPWGSFWQSRSFGAKMLRYE